MSAVDTRLEKVDNDCLWQFNTLADEQKKPEVLTVYVMRLNFVYVSCIMYGRLCCPYSSVMPNKYEE